MFDCENCELSADHCICAKVDKFFKENKHLMEDLAELEELEKEQNRKRKPSSDFYLDEITG